MPWTSVAVSSIIENLSRSMVCRQQLKMAIAKLSACHIR
jgi:hypothetical protein